MASCDGDGLVVSTLKEVRLLRIEDPARAPVEVWRAPLDRGPSTSTTAGALCGGGLVSVHGQTWPIVFDAATGARRCSTRAAVNAVDERGVITLQGPPPTLTALDPSGAELPFFPGPARLVALLPDVAVVRPQTPTFPHSGLPELALVDRRSGETRELGAETRGCADLVVVAADQLHLVRPRLGPAPGGRCPEPEAWSIAAVGLDGRLRWQLELDLPRAEIGVSSLAVTNGRVYVCTHRSTVIAIGERGSTS